MEVNRIYQEDCLKFMDTIPDESVDLVVTSPPYNFGGFSRNGRKSSYDTYEDNLPDEEYKDWIKNILTACNRILKIGGGIYWNHKGKFVNYAYEHPYWVIDLCPLSLRQHIIWRYNATPDVAKNKFYPFHEDIFYFSKGKPEYFNEDMAMLGDVWDIAKEQNNPHPAPFPLKLAKRCIAASCPEGGLVYDPFMGSGTSAVAAIVSKRNFIGTEISEKYIKIAEKRIKVAVSESLTLF